MNKKEKKDKKNKKKEEKNKSKKVKKIKKKAQEKLEALEERVLEKMSTLIISALGFVSALAWNDAFQTTFKKIFGQQQQISAKFIYAIILTIIVVIAGLQIDKAVKRLKNEQEEKEEE